ncbi:DUF4124 domain-containing protein [bacterium]|nr:DUF4124 domain-containing protein [bacterium]
MKRYPLSLLFLFFLAPVLLDPALLSAAPGGGVYTWKDENGVVHFATKAADPKAKKAELPEINRGDVKIAKPKLISCSAHGGTDCQAGADDDGSVICHDGFRGASARYRFTCNAPKLQITQVSPVDELGNFLVTVRNAKSVTAVSPALLYTPEAGVEIALKGPKEIEPYGVVDFLFEPKDADIPTGTVQLAQLEVKCANCP